jgi:hypothetical protein
MDCIGNQAPQMSVSIPLKGSHFDVLVASAFERDDIIGDVTLAVGLLPDLSPPIAVLLPGCTDPVREFKASTSGR